MRLYFNMIKIQFLPIIGIIVTMVIVYWVKFKITNPFWSKQPVIHPHNFFYSKPGVIWEQFCVPKFMNYTHVVTRAWREEKNKKQIQTFISANYCKEKDWHYSPSLKIHISPYYDYDTNAYLSSYYLDNILIGTIFNRTLRIHLSGANFAVSYIDYLCVHRGHRKKNVAPELIQTHEFYQRTKSAKKCMVTLFKKEGSLHWFTPLITYRALIYNLSQFQKFDFFQSQTPQNYDIVIGSLSIKYIILDFLEEVREKYTCFVIPPFETILALIERKSIVIYGLLNKKTESLDAMYFFRNTGLYINRGESSIECFASLYTRISDTFFTSTFFSILKSYYTPNTFLHLEEIGATAKVVDAIEKSGVTAKYTIPCAYYLYNYSNRSICNEKATIIL